MIIDTEITPYLETHNGGVEILEFDEKIKKFKKSIDDSKKL